MADTFPSFAEDIVSPANLIGRDEMNLAEFPLALLADTARAGQKTLYFEDSHGRLTVTGSDAYGLPTASDADVIVALLYLTKKRNNFTDPKVNFSKYELIKLLNWVDHGESYKRLDQSFNRWGGVWLVYDKCWWNNKIKKYGSAKMHILESVVIADAGGKRRDDQTDLPFSSFTWNQTFIESCQADNLRQLNLEVYFSLKSAVSKRLYRFLGKRFYVQNDWTFDLGEIAFDRVGLSRSYQGNAGKIKEKLQPAIEELESIGLLRPLSREQRYTKIDRGQWTIRLTKKPPALAATLAADAPGDPHPLIAELIQRGVSRKTALELLSENRSEAIDRKIEEFDFLVGKGDPKVSRSPAGYLVSSINGDYATPKGFVSKAELQRRQEVKEAKARVAAEERRRKAEMNAAEEAKLREIEAYWTALPPEEQSRVEADALADAGDEARQTYQLMKRLKAGAGYLASIRRDFIRNHLLAERAVEPA